ncbi:MAG: polymer-forming cytoskeletal protein [Kiloniellales bacterium]
MFNRVNRNGGVVGTTDSSGRSPATSAGLRAAVAPSIVAANLQVEGTLRSAGDIQIDGRVIGDVISRAVTISTEAHVQGQVTCETARVDGYLSGELRAKSVVVSKTAHITGDVVHECVAIEAGAHIEGNLKRISSEEAARLPPPEGEDWDQEGGSLVELADLEDEPPRKKDGKADA